MSDESIFLLQQGVLTPLKEQPYATEDILQKVLEDYPALIAGFATSGESGRLLLIRREMGVPGAGGPTGLSLDHLFVDETGVPVLVEVKRSSDTRARREVVAQMLDYVANGSLHWPLEQLRAAVLAQAAASQSGEAALLSEKLGVDDADAFWRLVEDNLRAGKVRCIFLADRLTPGLVRIIEFLNEQMRDTEVLGVELPQFVGESTSVVYVPQVVGRTASAVNTKERSTGTRWTKERLLDEAAQQCTPDELEMLKALFNHREARPGRFSWGTGVTAGVTGWYDVEATETPVWNVNLGPAAGQANLYFVFREYVSRHPHKAVELAAAVACVPGLAEKVAAAQHSEWRSWVGLTLVDATAHKDLVLAVLDKVTGEQNVELPSS